MEVTNKAEEASTPIKEHLIFVLQLVLVFVISIWFGKYLVR